MAGKFSDLTKGFTPERRKRIEAAKAALRREMARRIPATGRHNTIGVKVWI